MMCCLQNKTSVIRWVKANGKAREMPLLFDITLVQTWMANEQAALKNNFCFLPA